MANKVFSMKIAAAYWKLLGYKKAPNPVKNKNTDKKILAVKVIRIARSLTGSAMPSPDAEFRALELESFLFNFNQHLQHLRDPLTFVGGAPDD
jgi:hypothetical protein